MSDPPSEQLKSSAREFTIIVICALGLSVAFVYWLKSSGGLSQSGGLDVGKIAPPIEASAWVQGDAPQADSLAGEVRVLIAWATWCVPCSRKAPELVELHNRFADRGVHFFGLTAAPEQYRDLILEWLEARKITWPNGFGEQAIETLLAYESDVIPLIWVIGRDGTVVWNRSLEAEETLEQAIERALEQPRIEHNGTTALVPQEDSP